GQYGAGSMTIWDHGRYETLKWAKDEVKIRLHGQRVTGGYTLFQTGGKQWMMHRERQPLPPGLRPMLAALWSTPPPDDGRWALEMKWDGVRAVSAEHHMEGVVAKRLDSQYLAGTRTDNWRKIKNPLSQEVVVAGYKPGKGNRTGQVGSLLIGVNDDSGLIYAGHVGTGFSV